MTDRAHSLSLLRRALGNPAADFRDGQWEAIDRLVNHRHKLLVIQRTGWGKSIVYFIATRILRDRGSGPVLIVSPLLALMRNQIEVAERLGVSALTINSTNQGNWRKLTQSILSNNTDAILISPERLSNNSFVQNVFMPIADRIGLLVVDEAHCISDWGHDFRPDYRRLVNVLGYMPTDTPVLGTTATANNRVVDDVVAQLGDIHIQRGPLMRDSLALQTIRLPDQSSRLAWLAAHIPRLPGTGIVYTLTKRDADQVAQWLNRNHIKARAYYSDVEDTRFKSSDDYRQYLESLLLKNEVKTLVATTALGMGYDKPDLGFVIHYQAPGSIAAYYQQVGRAGRAINHAVGVMMTGCEDVEIHKYFSVTAFPEERHVNSILEALADSKGLTEGQIEETVNLPSFQIRKILKFISADNPSPVLNNGRKWLRTPIDYHMDHERGARHESREREIPCFFRASGIVFDTIPFREVPHAHTADPRTPTPESSRTDRRIARHASRNTVRLVADAKT